MNIHHTFREQSDFKNNHMIYKIARKNTLYNWKSLLLLLTSAMLSVSLIFTCLSLQNLLETLHSSDAWYMGYGLFETIKSTIIIIGALTILLMAFSLEYYVINRLYDYSLFIALGIKKRTLHFLVAFEYAGTLLLGFVLGISSGFIVIHILRHVIIEYFPALSSVRIEWIKTIGLTFLICLIIFLLSAMINFEVFVQKDLSNRFTEIGGKQRMPRFKKLSLSVGFFLIFAGTFFFHQRILNESIYAIVAILGGVYLVFRICLSSILQYIKQTKFYHNVIFSMNDFYYRFKKNYNYIFILFIFHVLALYYFVLQIATLYPIDDATELFPYDYVCMGDDTDTVFFTTLVDEYELSLVSMPMVRITVPGGDPSYEGGMSGSSFQGQNIGISNTSYNELTESSLSLQGKELHLIYQQDISDTAHTMDWNGTSNTPSIRAGMPYHYAWMDRYDIFDRTYSVASTERTLLFGYFYYGYQENIMVFSDEQFDSLVAEAESSDSPGASMLYLISLNDTSATIILPLLEQYAEQHAEYNDFNSHIKAVYDTQELLQNTTTEHLMKLIVNSFLYIFFMLGSTYIIVSNTLTELPELQKKNKFYTLMGMPPKRRLSTFTKSIYYSTLIPILLAMFVSGFLLVSVVSFRLFTSDEVSVFIENASLLWAIYIGVQLVGIFIVQHIIKKKVVAS